MKLYETCSANLYSKVFTSLLDPNSNKEEIKTKIIDSQYFWDGIVELGSRHLVLPAVYGNFKRKKIF